MKKSLLFIILMTSFSFNLNEKICSQTWNALGTGVNGGVYSIINGFGIVVGGGFSAAGNVPGNVLTWDGTSWNEMDTTNGVGGTVYALAYSQFKFYAGGSMQYRIMSNSGGVWSILGGGFEDDVKALAVSGNDIYAGGNFIWNGNNSRKFIAKWNGSAWQDLDTGFNGSVHALVEMGGNIYAGGVFIKGGGVGVDTLNRIAMWNGHWNRLGTGVNNSVLALAVMGGNLYAGGEFTTAGGVAANHIAMWNGSSWSPLGQGVSDVVLAMTVKDNILYVGGAFSTAGGITVNNIAKWNGTTWSALGTGTNNTVYALCTQGDNIYAGGVFTTASGITVNRIARWGSPIGINQISSELPSVFSLYQNYPNPFNPVTKIKFSLPKVSYVNVNVIDILGRHVATLVNEKLSQGTYETEWNAGNIPSGIYFYTIETEDTRETKKMILIK